MIIQRIKAGQAYWKSEGLGPFLVRSVTGSAAVQASGIVVGFLVGVQLARGLGVKGYGYYGMAMAVIMLATIPSTFGIPKLVTREIAAAQSRKDPGALHGVLRWADRVCMSVAAVVAVAVAIGAAIAWRTRSPIVGEAILFGAPLVMLLPLVSVRGGALRGLHHVVLAQLSNALLRPLAMSILLFAIFLAGARISAPEAMGLNSLTAAAAVALTSWWVLRRMPTGKAAPSKMDRRGWLASTIPLALSDAMMTMQQQLVVLLLGVLAAPAQVGLFRVSVSTASVIIVPMTVVNMVVLPMFSRLHTERDPRLQKLVTSSARIQIAGVLLFAAPLLLAARPLLHLVFGKGFASAATTVRILALGAIVTAAFGPNGSLLNMTGHERLVTRAAAISLVTNLALMVLLAPKLGSNGAAVGVFVGQCVWNVMLWLDAKRELSINTSGLRPGS